MQTPPTTPGQIPPTGPPQLVQERDELSRLIVSRFPLIYFDTREEERAERMLLVAAQQCGRRVWSWSASTGVTLIEEQRNDPATMAIIPALQRIAEQPGDDVFILRDAAQHITDSAVAERILRDIARVARLTIVLLGPHGAIPDSLRSASASIDIPPPEPVLIAAHVRAVLAHAQQNHGAANDLTPKGFDQLVSALRGLSLDEVDQVLLHLIHDDGRIDDSEVRRAIDEKARILAHSGVLSLETPTFGMDWVAGFTEVKAWVGSRDKAFSPEAIAFGLQPPRGILLTGVPGCGKSFVAKALAHEWNMPLLRLDAGSLYDSFIGASERNLRNALATAGALAPSVLWIDELEKGFGGTGPSQSDGGLGYRLLGALATWMQERPAPVFLVATSNDVTKLPPELLRQGRFDEVFFVDLPDLPAREHSYRLQLARVRRDHTNFDCALLAAKAEGFSGAEIEQSVTNGLYAAFAAGRELSTEDIVGEIAATRPLSVLDPTTIARIRDWGARHARPA
ncbi:MAG: ATPase central domain protein [Thermoleophilia bacterium]|nr:ATPase central domain protein [Thermoleophilia bacterium]